MKRLYVADLDETLLSSGSLAPHVAPAWKRIVQSGAPVTIATARGFRGTVSALGDAVPRLPLITLNGAVVTSLDESVNMVEAIEPELLSPLARLGTELTAPAVFLATDGRSDTIYAPAPGDPFTDWTIDEIHYFRAHEVIRSGLPALTGRMRIAKVVFCTTVPIAQELDRHIRGRYPTLSSAPIWSHDRPGFAWLEIGSAAGTKADAVARVASLLGYPMESVVYYGDSTNDLEVMQVVGEAVAVSNAESRVLDAAKRIIGSSKSGAVVLDLLEQLGDR